MKQTNNHIVEDNMQGGSAMVEWNDVLTERYELSCERIGQIKTEKLVPEKYQDYFGKVAAFLETMERLLRQVQEGSFRIKKEEVLAEENKALYADILPDNYKNSYGNPTYATDCFGIEEGRILCFLYTEIRGLIAYTVEGRQYDLLILQELFLEIYHYYADYDQETCKNASAAIRYYMMDYNYYLMESRTREMFDPSMSFATDIIMESDLINTKYLYYFGEYISDNERKIAEFLANQPEDVIYSMAKTYTEGYRRGFEINGIDLSKKSIVNIRYNIGFERMIKAAILQFREMGLEPVLYRAAVRSINKRQHLKIGYCSTSANRQYDYDHRFDDGLYLNRAFASKKLESCKMAYEKLNDCMKKFAGPAVVEVFGEIPFAPENKECAVTLKKKQQDLNVEFSRDAAILQNQYVPASEYSFTIIAYPLPSIGEEFPSIFADTIQVNNLDQETYKRIQQYMIDALDQGEYVHILGQGANTTDLRIMLPALQNPERQTNFENCLADVNIPLGEVFTSPRLTGTEGHFHVTKVYMNDLEYKDLTLEFEDGKITDYTCKNFEDEEKNREFVKQNLMYNHDTLPIGEFAIGTNTTAYRMGKKYGITDMLPILIAEKTGPHFAVGDTCYKMSEDTPVYNPDGKEIMARDNECSILRKTDVSKAYFNCHTDITIPYAELLEIAVVTPDGRRIPIIRKGLFVLPGTEELNGPLQQ